MNHSPRCGTTSYEEHSASQSIRRRLSTTNENARALTLSSTHISTPARERRADVGTPISFQEDWQQEDELQYFKFIHVLKASLFLPELLKAMIRPLYRKEKEGYLFASIPDDAPTLCRLSHTSRSTSRPIYKRLQEYRARCRRRFILIEDPGQRRVSNPSRLQRLIQIELSKYSRGEERCNGCGCNHCEWFELSAETALEVIERGRRWSDLQPYDADGLLKQNISAAAWLDRWLGI